MASNQLEITNLALAELGDMQLETIDDDNDAARTAKLQYLPIYHDLLSKAPWRFASQKATLSRLLAAPLNEWHSQFELPSDFMRVIRVYPDQNYEIFGLKIYANCTALACDYVAKISESLLPAHFVMLFAYSLAVALCKPVTGSESAKGVLREQVRYQFAASLSADAQQRPNKPILSSPFIAVRG